jgi:hypothetical protein
LSGRTQIKEREVNDKPDLLNIIEAAMNTCHAEGDYDPENDYIKDPLCRRVYHALGQSAAEITRLRDAVRVLGADLLVCRKIAAFPIKYHVYLNGVKCGCCGQMTHGVYEDDEGRIDHSKVYHSTNCLVTERKKTFAAVESDPIAAAAVRGEVKE